LAAHASGNKMINSANREDTIRNRRKALEQELELLQSLSSQSLSSPPTPREDPSFLRRPSASSHQSSRSNHSSRAASFSHNPSTPRSGFRDPVAARIDESFRGTPPMNPTIFSYEDISREDVRGEDRTRGESADNQPGLWSWYFANRSPQVTTREKAD
jgi:hypothetical protein